MSSFRFAVIMSVYKNDSVENFEAALKSVLKQDQCDVSVFLQVDGNVPDNLMDKVNQYHLKSNVFVDYSPISLGLAKQLNVAVTRIKNSTEKFDFIARMDSDDISMSSRFIKQANFLNSNPNVAVLGTDILEFYPDGKEYYKRMESNFDLIRAKLIGKCPLNHPTVVFDLNKIDLEDIVYDERLKNTQDYYLWVDLINKGYVLSNLNEPLLKFRVDESFNKRRGIKKLRNDFNSRVYAINKLNMHSFKNYALVFCLVVFRLSPSFLKNLAYRYLR